MNAVDHADVREELAYADAALQFAFDKLRDRGLNKTAHELHELRAQLREFVQNKDLA